MVFNPFEVLGSMALEEGIPPSMSSDLVSSTWGAPPHESHTKTQVVVHQQSEVPIALESSTVMTLREPQDNDICLTYLVKEVLASGKGMGSPLTFGFLQRPFKRVHFTPSLKSGH